jgi:long-chain acyl-CoA synthetase
MNTRRDARESGKINMADVASVEEASLDTWPKVLEFNHKRYGDSHKAMRYKHYGIWQAYTWQDYYQQVEHLALGLNSLGFQPGHKLLIIGDNAPQWYFGELAAQCCRGISVGLYSDLSAAEILYVARDCQPDFALIEDQEQVDKLAGLLPDLPNLRQVIYWHFKGLTRMNDPKFKSLGDVLQMGRDFKKDHPDVLEKMIAAGRGDDICSLIYPSGTTGAGPKGTLHSHGSLMFTSRYFKKLDNLTTSDNLVSYLPPAWITEQWLGLGCHLLSGGTLNFPENAETQQQDIREIGPSLVLYNARLWERQAGQVQARLKGSGALKKLAYRWLMPAGYRRAEQLYQKKPLGWRLSLWYFLAYWLLVRPLRDSMGLPHTRVCYTCGTTLGQESMRFYHSLGIPLKNVFGSSEGGALTAPANQDIQPDKLGRVIPGIELKITPEGEIITRHAGIFKGYYSNPELTAQVLRDGWVYTGDAGSLSEDGNLLFLDRISDLTRSACGNMIAPQDIESRLKSSGYIKDAWVLAGNDCQFTTAVIIIDSTNTGNWADKQKITYTTFGDLSQKSAVYGLIEREIKSINSGLPEGSKIGRYVNLHKEFDPDESELTRTRKLRKGILREKYASLATALASGQNQVTVDAQFTYQDGRVGRLKTVLQIKTVGEGG